ncbi:MAG: hypothetical protein FJ194_05825 [Gammaproteobacteria bacterium]|nr:hypothetical protein [Gammaproteobacteria bacterium]
MPHFALRFADSHSAARYPLPVAGPLLFLGQGESRIIRADLPPLPAHWIVAASFVTPGAITPTHQFRLLTNEHTWSLLPVPSQPGQRPDLTAMDPSVSVHIDCWHTHVSIQAPRIELVINTTSAPRHYLLCISARPVQLDVGPASAACIVADPPQKLSQMTAADSVRHHICSPTSVAMLLPGAARDPIATACRDNATGLYGSWPMAVRTAAAAGAVAGVELHDSWSQALHVMREGYAFAASIRYAPGSLTGAPLASTAGHLVVVHSIGEGRVLVHDPAAASDEATAISHDIDEFSRAWLASRGASYIIAP